MLVLKAATRCLTQGLYPQNRTFFSLPELPSFPPFESKPQTYKESRVLPYSQKELYSVVADVASYPQFIPFCTASKIDRSVLERALQEKTVAEAQLSVGFLNFTESYTSVVTCDPVKSVQAVASSSTPLFRSLSTMWQFEPHHPNGSKLTRGTSATSTLVSYALEFQFANPLHASVSSAFFNRVSSLMIKAFEDRCSEIYGPRP